MQERLRIVGDRGFDDLVRSKHLHELGLGEDIRRGGPVAPENHEQRDGAENGDPNEIGAGRHAEFAIAFSAAFLVFIFIFVGHEFSVLCAKPSMGISPTQPKPDAHQLDIPHTR